MPAINKKQVDPSHTIEHQRTVINDMAGDLHSLFVGTAAINAATIQVAGADIGAISDHIDRTIFFYYGGFAVDTTIGAAAKLGEVFSHEDAFVDIDDGVTVTVDDGCVLALSNKTKYEFFTNATEETNIQKLTGFADNSRTSVVADITLGGTKKVGFVSIPDFLEATPLDYFTPTAATYDPTTGLLVLTIGSHTIKAGDQIKIAPYSLNFSCDYDSHTTNHPYPRSTDPVYNKDITVEAVTSDTLTVKVLTNTPSTNTTAHTFVSADQNCISFGGADFDDLAFDIDDTFTLTIDEGAVLII